MMCEAAMLCQGARRVMAATSAPSCGCNVATSAACGGKMVVLLACGSFNPLTYMHLRMFELARDALHRTGRFRVMGGMISPVHDAYGKKDLASAMHRKEMLRLALQSSDWLRVSEWETNQEGWTPTRQVLSYHQNQLNTFLSGAADNKSNCDRLPWLTDKAHCEIAKGGGHVQVRLLCGADLIETFATPGLWKEEDVEAITGDFGLVVITRSGVNAQRLVYESDLLSKNEKNIDIVREWISNEVSATRLRRGLRRGESVRYLLPDAVLEYIYHHGLYCANQNKYNPDECPELDNEVKVSSMFTTLRIDDSNNKQKEIIHVENDTNAGNVQIKITEFGITVISDRETTV